VASVCSSRVHSHTYQFVFKTVIYDRLLLNFLFGLTSWFSQRVDVVLGISRDHVMVAVGFQVKNLRELKVLVDFVISECIEVENDSLQVNDQDVGSFCDQRTLANIDCLFAAITLVIVYYFALNHFLEAVID